MMKQDTQDTRLSRILFNAILSFVAYDESWTEPKKVYTSKKEFSKFPYKYEVKQLNEKVVEINSDKGVRVFPVIQQIEIIPRGRKKETHITLSDDFWYLVKKLRKKWLISDDG